MLLYHDKLDQIIEVPDNEATVEVLRKSGWEVAADPEDQGPAVVPEQPKRARKPRGAEDDSAES